MLRHPSPAATAVEAPACGDLAPQERGEVRRLPSLDAIHSKSLHERAVSYLAPHVGGVVAAKPRLRGAAAGEGRRSTTQYAKNFSKQPRGRGRNAPPFKE
jgi:hypothetical protein